MTTTDEKAARDGGAGRPPARPPGWGRALRRYGPVAAVVALVAGAVVVFGGGGGDGDGGDGEGTADAGIPSTEELIRSGPMTPQRAELEGIDLDEIDWGPTCDTERMQLALPMRLVPPCVSGCPRPARGGGAQPRATGSRQQPAPPPPGRPPRRGPSPLPPRPPARPAGRGRAARGEPGAGPAPNPPHHPPAPPPPLHP